MTLRKSLVIAGVLGVSVIFSACQATDVIGKAAVVSFEEVLKESQDKVSLETDTNAWVLESPAGDEFKWSKDFSSTEADGVIAFDAKPFMNAGLDVAKLPDNYSYDPAQDRLTLSFELGQEKFNYSGEATAIDSFKKIVEVKRDLIGYHEALDHYGIALGSGNMFEWAKDMDKNDKDIVFVLEPKPFIEAGVDPNQVEGWIFAKVEMKEDGKMVEVDKLLKPFYIK